MFKVGQVVRGQKGWDCAGKIAVVVTAPVNVLGMPWVGVLFDGDEDPEFLKEGAIEPTDFKLDKNFIVY